MFLRLEQSSICLETDDDIIFQDYTAKYNYKKVRNALHRKHMSLISCVAKFDKFFQGTIPEHLSEII